MAKLTKKEKKVKKTYNLELTKKELHILYAALNGSFARDDGTNRVFHSTFEPISDEVRAGKGGAKYIYTPRDAGNQLSVNPNA